MATRDGAMLLQQQVEGLSNIVFNLSPAEDEFRVEGRFGLGSYGW